MRKKVLAEKSVEQGLNQFQFIEFPKIHRRAQLFALYQRIAFGNHISKRASGLFARCSPFSLWDQFILKNPPPTREAKLPCPALVSLPTCGDYIATKVQPPKKAPSREGGSCPKGAEGRPPTNCIRSPTFPAPTSRRAGPATQAWGGNADRPKGGRRSDPCRGRALTQAARVGQASGPDRSIVVQGTAVPRTRFTPHLRVCHSPTLTRLRRELPPDGGRTVKEQVIQQQEKTCIR